MRVIKSLTVLIFAALLSTAASAQVTAVMQAKVNVVSGASLTVPNQTIVELPTLSSAKFEAMNFTITAAPSTDMDISINQRSQFSNQDGEVVDLKDIQVNKKESQKGHHTISIEGTLEEGQELEGKYQGTFTAVVEYL